MGKAVYFKGILLRDALRWWYPVPAATGLTRAQGLFQQFGKIVPDSPAIFEDIVVKTEVEPVTALTGISRQATLHLALAQLRARLAAAADSLGSLAWIDDTDRVATVTGGPYSAGSPVAVSHGTPGGSWTPATNYYVLVRDPTTHAGFVAEIEGVGAGTVTLTLEEAITAGWEIHDVLMHYDEVGYDRMNPGEPQQTAEDVWRSLCEFYFVAAEDLVYASVYEVSA